ncbi:MAG: Asp-tRNA(Asn)/Glu-tRNA(Gln) amidotransferase subunit GatC [Anaerolineae bacterium]|nr:Asp-tRNA(Asn)/Glu-tRNA(Gln) amidotransferase subunit GatC [Anaerolineae bacterium]MCO5189731.1 Asp-tRNA(Asn)/Glu-tRNA(Gln) amidotransferase subunit GatC [Anaerolineae bacterium]MCO5193190.1 Asp-tRNA(Asn)/Glu-tRNA(Gln) amidotransferase subunit GatC [Anaerolineae bacterium]MCO5205441.1 Asp-tRNA(Asn)/Glu-tRNA(Gln) amidotransferase subunit GatC [Anaerolineae bacterium]
MELTRQQVEQIAHLARLDLSAEEITLYQNQLSAILDAADRLTELDLDGVLPTARAVPMQNVMRPDRVEPSLPLEDVLYNTDHQASDQFVIQAILDD